MDKKEVYSIDGMSCASCAAHVEESVKSLEGVSDVSVNLATERCNKCCRESRLWT